EPDARRRLPPREEMGAADVRALDLDDMGWPPDSAAERRAKVAALEARCREVAADAPVRSLSVNWWDGRIDSGMVTSNGFSSRWQRTSMGYGGSITLEEPGGRLPEGYQYCAARHSEDLMSFDDVATALLEQGTRRMKSTAAPSGRYAMLLDKQVVGQLMRVLIGPLGGTAVYEGRSCLKDKLGARIAPEGFSIIDDPLIPRALGSRPYTGDGFPSMQRAVLEDGVLRTFFISLYNARRLGVAPTTGGASNLVIAPGDQSPEALMKAAGRVIRVEGFLGGNTSEITGDFSFGVNGTLFENGEPVQAVSEMNISGNLFELMERWQAAADDVWTYSAWRSPSLLFDDIQFSGT
ncbi:MAG: metallopeptidase TldD-related protein, partial [Myxococcota bacterium]